LIEVRYVPGSEPAAIGSTWKVLGCPVEETSNRLLDELAERGAALRDMQF
jgi:hypothetical protein|tara:strand:+ start:1146 stop:1295 length:150 start_codon:yes stop_codon:yes gene_type:complete